MAVCNVCFRRCSLEEGRVGSCGARIGRNGAVEPLWYGRISSVALDPIEKKPLYHFYPGSRILSVGSLGCNLHCPFCQNHEIAQAEGKGGFSVPVETVSPTELAELAERCRSRGNIGIAFTYNEPLVGYEFVRDTARLAKKKGLLNVLVTNGTAAPEILEEIAPYVDAMNIDLKGFTPEFYRDFLGGDLEMVKEFIRTAAESCHVELTKLIIPEKNDSEDEMRRMADWIASLRGGKGRNIPLHVSRYFPRYKWTAPATPVKTVYRLADAARERLDYVYTGNC